MHKASSLMTALAPGSLLLASTAACLLLLCAPQAAAQGRQFPPTTRADQSSGVGPPMGRGTEPSPMDMPMSPDFARETAARREAARKVERKRRMVDSANRLLALTQQLRAELATREATPDDAKRLDEIARLARTVKDQMRD